ncbi:9811_t:CDS:2, partial [Dentiscutata heterogama]
YEDIEVNQNVQDSSASTDQDLSNLNSEIDEATTYTPLKILQTINEYNTRWGSSLASWKRLKELKGPIQHVIFKLSLETSKEAKKDYEILKKRFLKYWEWDLLDHLIDLFKPIEEATEWLGGQKYCTLSLIYPTIQALKYDYVEETEKTDSSINRPNFTKTINLVKNAIYDALYNYFDSPPNSVLLASILDPRFKKMKRWPEEEKERTITLLRSEYTLFKNDELLNRESGNKNRYHFKEPKEKTISNFKSRLFEEEEEEINDDDEIDCYL